MKAFLSFLLGLQTCMLAAQSYTVTSPDGMIQAEISVGSDISFSVSCGSDQILQESTIALRIAGAKTGEWKASNISRHSVDETIRPVVPEMNSEIRDHYNQLTIELSDQISLSFRVFDNGLAYRWESRIPGNIKIMDEMASFVFHPKDLVWYPLESSFYSHNERLYKQYRMDRIGRDSLASLPVLVQHGNVNLLITEADLFDYPGMWLTGNGNENGLAAKFPPYPAAESQAGDRNLRVTKTEDFIASSTGNRTYPWRLIIISQDDKGLMENQLVYQLSRSTEEDFSWVRPGKVAWDWWNALNLYQVDFRAGINTETYKYYIDFAAAYGLDYIILDEGWSPTTDITVCMDEIDMQELVSYAREQHVGIILWVLWTTLDRQMEEALNNYRSWGISGIKVDFMQRDDQVAVNFYERTAREASLRHLLVDFHGSFKPTGLERMYPNVLTREGVYGLEQSKWDNSKNIAPPHNVTLPYIRNAVGPMDYTPGAMINANSNDWAPVYDRPMSLGTRCHQLAMYVVYTSPLQMLADAPSNYYREPECMEFLSRVPAVWDRTVALDGKVGDYAVIARRKENGDWYIGAMTNWNARDIDIDFSFLGDGIYSAEIWQDGINADRVAIDFERQTWEVGNQVTRTVHLAPGGGWVAIIHQP